jgi:hypothetical protein
MDAIDSLVPLFYAQENSLEEAWRLTTDLISSLVKEFDEAAARLLYRSVAKPEFSKLKDFVIACQHISTGNLKWR